MILWTYKQWLNFLVISNSCLSLIENIMKSCGVLEEGVLILKDMGFGVMEYNDKIVKERWKKPSRL
jgi:hypothetical protein